jgi:hypothetical protein
MLDAVMHERANRLEPVTGSEGLHLIEQGDNELLRHERDRLVAMLVAEALKNGAAHCRRPAG